MDRTQWNIAMNFVDKYDIKALLGVVPDCLDPDLQVDEPIDNFWEYIRELQSKGHTIAMHGLHHLLEINADGIITKNKKSEFAGYSYDIQLEKIKRGKAILAQHGIQTDVFFAPAHSYDDNTLKALAANGFRYISDGKSRKPYSKYGIICIPARDFGLSWLSFLNGNYSTLIFHTNEWKNKGKKLLWDKLIMMVSNKNLKFLSFEDVIKRPQGNYYLQKTDEKIFMWVENNLLPMAYSFYKLIHF